MEKTPHGKTFFSGQGAGRRRTKIASIFTIFIDIYVTPNVNNCLM